MAVCRVPRSDQNEPRPQTLMHNGSQTGRAGLSMAALQNLLAQLLVAGLDQLC